MAAEHGHSEIVQYLVNAGASVKAVRRGLTLVQWAIYRADIKLIIFLIKYCANPDLSIRTKWFSMDTLPSFGEW